MGSLKVCNHSAADIHLLFLLLARGHCVGADAGGCIQLVRWKMNGQFLGDQRQG